MDGTALTGGFADAPIDAARAFRAALQAMARPGRIETIPNVAPPAPLSPAAGCLLLTLCDTETQLHLAGGHDCADVRDWVTFHCGAALVGAAEAEFAVGRWHDLAPLSSYRIGTPEYPDGSASLIVELDELRAEGARLTGPGIRDAARLSLPQVEAFETNAGLFPLGLDFFLTAGDRLAALPRTTRVEAG